MDTAQNKSGSIFLAVDRIPSYVAFFILSFFLIYTYTTCLRMDFSISFYDGNLVFLNGF